MSEYLNTEDKNVADHDQTRARETFLADVHIGVISIAEEGRGPLRCQSGMPMMREEICES